MPIDTLLAYVGVYDSVADMGAKVEQAMKTRGQAPAKGP
jgi:hypothetical protein